MIARPEIQHRMNKRRATDGDDDEFERFKEKYCSSSPSVTSPNSESTSSSSTSNHPGSSSNIKSTSSSESMSSNTKPTSSLSPPSSQTEGPLGNYHQKQPTSFTNPKQLYCNYLNHKNQGLPVIQMSDVTAGKPSRVAIISYASGSKVAFHQKYLQQYLIPELHVDFIFKSLEQARPSTGIDNWMAHFNGNVNFIQCMAKASSYAHQHAKCILLKYPNYLRVFISTSNACHDEMHGGDIGQFNWCMDMPKKKVTNSSSSSSSSAATTTSPFASQLCHVLEKLFNDTYQDAYNLWKEIITEEYDFSVVDGDVNLVSSIPTEEEEGYALNNLKKHLQNRMQHSFCKTDMLECMSSSVSSFHLLQKPLMVATDCETNHLRLIYPTNVTRPRAKLCFNLCESSWNQVKPQLFRPSLLYNYIPSQEQINANRSDVYHHSKMMIRENKEGNGWIYVGSANMSAGAWGIGRHKNFEMGILLTNVTMSSYKNIIPWDRNKNVIENSRYTNNMKPFQRNSSTSNKKRKK